MVSECLARIKVAYTTLSTAVLATEKCFAKVPRYSKHGNFERFVQSQYTLAEKCYYRIVMYISPMSDSSQWLLWRNNYFKIISNAPSNLICSIWKYILYLLWQFFWCLPNDIALKCLFLHHCVVFSLFCIAIVIFEQFFARAYFRPDFAAIRWKKFAA